MTDPGSLLQTAFDLGVSSLECVEKWWQESNGRTDEYRMVTRSLRDICQMVKLLSKGGKSCPAVNREILDKNLASIQRLALGRKISY